MKQVTRANSKGLFTEATVTDEGRLQYSFCFKTVFNLSQRVLLEIEIHVYQKGLDFASIQKSINKHELKKDFKDFSRRMRTSWNFRYQLSEDFSDKPPFRHKSNWKPPPDRLGLELFLSQLGKEIFDCLLKQQHPLDLTPKKYTEQRIPLHALVSVLPVYIIV